MADTMDTIDTPSGEHLLIEGTEEGTDDASSTGTPSYTYVVSNNDKKLVKVVFLLLGVGFLLPWNAFISASAYFVNRTCVEAISTDASVNDSSDNENNFMLWFGLSYNFSGVITLGLMLLVQRLKDTKATSTNTPTETNDTDEEQSGGNTQWRMIVISLSFCLLIMILTTSMVLIPSTDPTLFQFLSLSSASVCGMSGAFTSAGITSFANTFPPDLGIQPFISGQAVGGVVISLLNFILFGTESTGADIFWKEKCSASAGESFAEKDGVSPMRSDWSGVSQSHMCESYQIDWGAFAYFMAGVFCIVLCIVLFIYLDQSEIAEHYRMLGIAASESRTADIVIQDRIEEHIDMDLQVEMAEHELTEPLLNTEETVEDMNMQSNVSVANHRDDEVLSNGSLLNETQAQLVWSSIRTPVATIFTTFLVTLTIFPSWTSKLKSVHQCQDRSMRLSNDLFVPGFIVLFNVFDFAGRTACGFVNIDFFSKGSPERLTLLSFARIAFLPLFLLCNVTGSKLVPPIKIFYSDWFPFLFAMIFAFGNGFVSTLAFIQAAVASPQGEEAQQIASIFLNFSVGLGCLSGSLFSFLYNYIGTREL